MTSPLAIEFTEIDLDAIAQASGRVVVFVPDTAKLDQTARRVNRLTRGALERFVQSKAFGDLKTGQSLDL
ncbi:MAG: leucyl aminopeptidase, partial [Mangrovicoccus sp.]|nr:leucyl aminopeptidase [Mangrovicoccus sp.]